MSQHCCKVEAINKKYDIDSTVMGKGLNEYLKARWEGWDGYPETGIRPLTTWFNKQLVRILYTEHDRRAIETQIDADYNALTSDDPIIRGAIIDDLAEYSIDGEQLINDFVSTATIYRHLRDHLNANKPKKAQSQTNWEQQKIEYVQETMQRSIYEALRSLENKSRLPHATTAEVRTQIILACPECSSQVQFERALDRGYICDSHLLDDE